MRIGNGGLLFILSTLFVATSAYAKPVNYTFDVQAAGTSVTKTGGGLAFTFLNVSYFPAKDFSKASIKYKEDWRGLGTVQWELSKLMAQLQPYSRW